MCPSRPLAFRGLGGGGSGPGSAVCLPLSGPPVHFPGGCGEWLGGPGPGPPQRSGSLACPGAARRCPGRATPARQPTARVTAWWGRSPSRPVMCEWPRGGVQQGGLMRPFPRPAWPGLSGVLQREVRPGGLAAGGSVPVVVSACAPCAAGSLLRSPPSTCPGARAAWGGGTGGLGPGSGGWCPSGVHLRPLACTPLRPAIRGLAHWAPGRRFGLRPRSPCCWRRCRCIVRCCGGSGGVDPAFAGAGGGGPGQGQLSVVSGSEGLHYRTRPRPPRRRCAPTWPHPRPLARSCHGPQDRGLRLLHMSRCADGRGGGVLRVEGPGPAGGRAGLSVRSHPPVLPVWRPRLRLLGVEPLPSGLAVICASVCVGAGASAVAGASGGSTSG